MSYKEKPCMEWVDICSCIWVQFVAKYIKSYYAGECDLVLQMIYFTDPLTYHDRQHEQLNVLRVEKTRKERTGKELRP